MQEDRNIKIQVIERVQHLSKMARIKFGIDLPIPKMKYTVKGTAAGCANYGQWEMCFNPTLLKHNIDEFIHHTVGHEYAHLITFKQYGIDIFAHGKEWQHVMSKFELPPRITHRYDISVIPTTNYIWECECSQHPVSSKKHKAMLKESYSCTSCTSVVKYIK